MKRKALAKKVGYQRKGYRWSKSIKRYQKTGTFKHVWQGQGHTAGESWGDAKQVDPNSSQRRYSKNSPSFDEGVYKSKQKRKMAEKMPAESGFKAKIKNNISRLEGVKNPMKW